MPRPSTVLESALALVETLKSDNHQLVLAESCTAGLVASTIAGIPGASSVLVGSAVVYQIATKQQWLEIPAQHFENFDVVSGETSQAMADGLLSRTPWATVAASITGHLGPNAPVHLDGIAWATVAIMRRNGKAIKCTQKLDLDQQDDLVAELPQQNRSRRQSEASNQLIRLITDTLKKS